PLTASASKLSVLRKSIDEAVQATQIHARASDKAKKDMAVGSRTIRTLFHEANLISLSPTLVFDAASIGPAVPGKPSTRYGVGGGARFTILSTLRLTFGYAVNLQRQAGEGPGALFASMEIL